MRTSSPVPDLRNVVRWPAGLVLLASLAMMQPGAASEQSDNGISPNSAIDVRSAQPGTTLTPEAVVRIQMDALGSNETWGDDAGIEVAFRFASPANRRMTGPLERFISLLKNPLYAPMLNHNSIEFAPSRDREGKAWIPVRLTSADGSRAGYLFILGRQDGDPCECWMTESVQRIPLGEGGTAPRGSAI